MNIQVRFESLVQEVLNQPGAEDTNLKHFNGIKPSMIPTDFSDLEGYEVIEDEVSIYKG